MGGVDSSVGVREVEQRDVAPLAALVREVLAELGLEFGVGSATDDEVLRLPSSYLDRGGAFWIAEDELGLLGSCGIFPLDATRFELRKMYVHRRARGRGVGRSLLERAVEEARGRGATALVLDTLHTMEDAIRL